MSSYTLKTYSVEMVIQSDSFVIIEQSMGVGRL